MIDIRLIRENKDLVKENIKKKFQDKKILIVAKEPVRKVHSSTQVSGSIMWVLLAPELKTPSLS